MKPLRLIVGIHQRLAWSIEYAGLTPGQFDRRMKWDRGTAARILTQESPVPEDLAAIAELLGVSEHWLSTGEPRPEARESAADFSWKLHGSNVSHEDREQLLDCIRVM